MPSVKPSTQSEQAHRQIKVGLGRRNYSYRRVCYDLPVERVTFAKVPYLPWDRLSRKNEVLKNTYAFIPARGVGLFHLWNGICLNNAPWITNFEAHLPRFFRPSESLAHRIGMQRLRHQSCKRLLALSDYARHFFMVQNVGVDKALIDKIEVFYGGCTVIDRTDAASDRPFRLCTVGDEFFRKGGIGILRAFDRLRRKMPTAELHIVSGLVANDYVTRTTPEDREQAVDMIRRMPNVVWREGLPHADVMRLLAECDVGLLPSLDDTFGWSALEAMSVGLPVVATNLCAMPEIVEQGHNGYLVELPKQENRRWAGLSQRDDRARRQALDMAYDAIADGIVAAVSELEGDRERLREMSRAAIEHVKRRHDPIRLADRLREIYLEAIN